MFDSARPFETCEHSAFRLEALPQYIVESEKESLAHFAATGEVRYSSEWSDLVARRVSDGVTFERLRLFSKKLTDYERFEIQAYTGPAVGERIKTALRDDYADAYRYDFWLFDETWIAQVGYEADGTFIGFDVRRATDIELDAYRYWRAVYEGASDLRQVPFVANTPDETHCLQAAYMSIAKYFEPTFATAMDEWACITGYEEGLGTWASAGLVWLSEHGYDVVHCEVFDASEFSRRPREYMIELYGEEAGVWAFEHTNVAAEIPRLQRLAESGVHHQKEPTLDDVRQYIDEGYLVRVSINCRVLDGRDGYVGHAVVVTAYNDEFIQFHDPGLPAIPNRQATYDEFERAWGEQSRELDAIRRQER